MSTEKALVSSRVRGGGARRATLLGSYVAPEVVAHIMSDGRAPLLSGVRLPVTVLFADIRGFTRLADCLPAERVVSMLDEYFAAMTAAALAHDAMIDKLIGDAIMLLYGVPASRGDEATRALYTADDMQRRFAGLVGAWRRAFGSAPRVGLGIGCACGEVVLANVGSAARMDYTAIGSPVNLAARLAAAAPRGVTLVSALVRAQADPSDTAIRFSRRRALALKGFRGSPVAYACGVLGRRPAAEAAAVIEDPVCGMKVNPQSAIMRACGRKAYYFCSTACERIFARHPERYAEGGQ
jgi:class 3 adenylate cyclase/YHS domain-containing protein